MRGTSAAPQARRSILVVALLLVSLGLMGVLTWEAYDAARAQRATVEAVMQDYASLAGAEFVRRAAAQVGYYGHYTLLNALKVSADLPAREDLGVNPDDPIVRSLSLATYLFRVPLEGGPAETLGGPVEEDVRRWLEQAVGDHAAALRQSEQPFLFARGVVNGIEHRIAFIRSEAVGEPFVMGFEVDMVALKEWFDAAFQRDPLLPGSLGDGDLGNEVLFLSVVDPAGAEIFHGGGRHASPFIAEIPFGDTYSGIFRGMTVRVSIDPASASQLVIGGLPYSRLPLLVLLLLLTAGFVVAALLQLRREQALAALRSEFVARVSHELRTPLTQIRMFAETLLLGRVRGDDERQRSLEIINQESQRLGHLVENILQLSRSERGAVKLAPRPQLLAPVLRGVLESFRPLAQRRDVRLAADLDDASMAAVDEDALRQICLNLLDNAVKYGPAGQTVRVCLRLDDADVVVHVEDEGPGIPADQREVIWKRFRRLERDRKSAVAGTGIGLSVVRDLVTRQGGKVLVKDGDHGARFEVRFPVVSAPAPAGQPGLALPSFPGGGDP
jgi:signal transduction histidine kinase